MFILAFMYISLLIGLATNSGAFSSDFYLMSDSFVILLLIFICELNFVENIFLHTTLIINSYGCVIMLCYLILRIIEPDWPRFVIDLACLLSRAISYSCNQSLFGTTWKKCVFSILLLLNIAFEIAYIILDRGEFVEWLQEATELFIYLYYSFLFVRTWISTL